MLSLLQPLLTSFAACGQKGIAANVLPSWHQFLGDQADPIQGCTAKFSFPGDLDLVALGLVDVLLRIAAYVAIGFVIYGGIQYVMSQGDPGKLTEARNTIVNALTGLVIAILATAIVTFIGNSLTP